MLLHSMVNIGCDTRIELSIPVTDVNKPHHAPSESAWFQSGNIPAKKGAYCPLFFWYTGLLSSRTHTKHTYPVCMVRPDMSKARPESRKYRNPIIYAQELRNEMVCDGLTRKQLAERHGISSDRITQWLCLLKIPEGKLKEIKSLGDNWDRQMVTERELRKIRRSLAQKNKAVTFN